MNISVIGLGKLGAPIVAVAASKGFHVIGVDKNPDYVEKINQGQTPVREPGLAEMLSWHKANIRATQSTPEAVMVSDITFIIVPTPSTPQGDFSIDYVKAAIREIGEAIKIKNSFHVVAVCSTVMPGDVDREIIPLLEQVTGKQCGRDFGVSYNPEFIALGSVIRDLQHPDFILLGESDAHTGSILESFYQRFTSNNPPIRHMNIVNAELSKVSINAYVTNKISFANLLSEICDRLPGGNVDEVTNAIGLDTRIGLKYLRGGLGFGGPCFPRDNRAIGFAYDRIGLRHPLSFATDEVNQRHTDFLINKIANVLPANSSVAVLGMSYKPDTDVIEESQGVALAKALSQKGFRVTIFDPSAMNNAVKAVPEAIPAANLAEAVKDKDAVCITTQWKEILDLDPELLRRPGQKPLLIDCWRLLDGKRFQDVARYIPIGIHQSF